MTHTLPGEEARARLEQLVTERRNRPSHIRTLVDDEDATITVGLLDLETLLALAHQSPSRAAGEDDRLREALREIVALLGTARQPIPDRGAALRIAKAALDVAATPHPVTGNDELTGREALEARATWFRFEVGTGEYTGEYCSVKPHDAAGFVPMISVDAALATPAELPALPSREEIERAFQGHEHIDREALKRWREADQYGRDLCANGNTVARMARTIDALEAIALATLHPPASVAEVEGLREALGICKRVRDESEHTSAAAADYRIGFAAGAGGCVALICDEINRRSTATPMPSGEKG